MTELSRHLQKSTAAAQEDLEDARASLEAVLEKITEGQATEQDLEVAERRVRFCEARLEGARRREAEEAEEERLRAIEDLAGRNKERVEAAGVQKARRGAERALERYVSACMAHNEAVDETVGELLSQQDLLQGYGVDMGRDGHSVVLGTESITRVRPMIGVRDMGLAVLGRHLRGGYISLGDDAY